MAVTLASFAEVPPLGTVLSLGDQDYVLIGVDPHLRLDGSTTSLCVWQSHCAQCGTPYVCRSPLRIHSLNRRCDIHKRPGFRPGGKRGARPLADTVSIQSPVIG